MTAPRAGRGPAGKERTLPYTLEQTERELAEEDILVLPTPLRSHRCLALQDGRIVGVDPARFGTEAELRTALIHEQAHFDSGTFYLPYSPYQLKCQAEYRTDKAAILKNIPYAELAARLRRGDTLPELAEYFCVTEAFVQKAYELYRAMGRRFE